MEEMSTKILNQDEKRLFTINFEEASDKIENDYWGTISQAKKIASKMANGQPKITISSVWAEETPNDFKSTAITIRPAGQKDWLDNYKIYERDCF